MLRTKVQQLHLEVLHLQKYISPDVSIDKSNISRGTCTHCVYKAPKQGVQVRYLKLFSKKRTAGVLNYVWSANRRILIRSHFLLGRERIVCLYDKERVPNGMMTFFFSLKWNPVLNPFQIAMKTFF